MRETGRRVLSGVVLGLGVWGCGGGSSPSALIDGRTNAWVICQEAARRQLTRPRTADFGSVLKGTFQRPTDTVTELGSDLYRCRGWVDTQDGLGAAVRFDFEMTVRDHRDAEGTWSVVSVTKFDQR